MGLRTPMCQDRTMQVEAYTTLGANGSPYLFAGVLTVIASLIVVVVMLITSRTDNGK